MQRGFRHGLLGEDFDKQATLDEIRELLTEAKQLALSHASEIQNVRRLLDRFRDATVTEALNNVELALREPQDGTTLPALAYDYVKIVEVTSDLGACVQRLFDDIERKIDSALETSGAAVENTMIGRVTAELESVQAVVNDYMEICSYDRS